MPAVSAPEKWAVCDSCGEIVRDSLNPDARQLYHSPLCPHWLPGGHRRVRPAARYVSSPGHGRRRQLGTGISGRTARAMHAAPGLLPRGQGRRIVLGLTMAGCAVALTATLVVSGHMAGTALPSAAGQQNLAAGGAVPTPAGGSPSPASPAPHPAADPAPAFILRTVAPSPSPTPSASPSPQLVLISFQDGGTDGWMQEWGNIRLIPSTSPAFDGASLVLVTHSGQSAIGIGSDGAPQLTTGETVTYHIWSSGEPGSVQPFLADQNNNIYYAGSADLPSTPGWFTLTWTVPAAPSNEGIGLQVTNPNPGNSLKLALGGVSWPQN